MQKSFSSHKIYTPNNFSFNPKEYSRFKFGDDAIAEKFGVQLAQDFIAKEFEKNPSANQIVVLSSPYSFIPTATFAMKNHFVFELNKWLSENNSKVVQEAKIHRTITYKEDYGALDAAERMRLIGNDSFHIDSVFLEGKTLIFLDDIKITGGHERMIKKMIDAYKLNNEIHLLYFAELVSPDIHPNIENELNYYCVKSIFDLSDIIHSNRFSINTRVVKFLLHSDISLFKVFVKDLNSDQVHLIYNMAIGNGYHNMEVYEKNLNHLYHLQHSTLKSEFQNGV